MNDVRSKTLITAAELERLLEAGIADWRAQLQIRYALAKELEDLGGFDRSFLQLQLGARLRRDHLRYDVANDVATVDWIIEAFPAAPAGPTPSAKCPLPLTSIAAIQSLPKGVTR